MITKWHRWFRSYQRFYHINEAKGSFSIVLTLKPRLHGAVNKGGFARGRNYDNSCNSWAGSMQRILCSDWLPERARWSDTARPGLPVSFLQIKIRQSSSECTKVFFSPKSLSAKIKRFFVISLSLWNQKKRQREWNKENKKYVLQQKPASTNVCFEFENLKIWIWNLNLKCNQSNDCIFCIYPIRIYGHAPSL